MRGSGGRDMTLSNFSNPSSHGIRWHMRKEGAEDERHKRERRWVHNSATLQGKSEKLLASPHADGSYSLVSHLKAPHRQPKKVLLFPYSCKSYVSACTVFIPQKTLVDRFFLILDVPSNSRCTRFLLIYYFTLARGPSPP